MGLFSWIATTGRKSEAASLIQQYLELSKQNGMFAGDPASTANKLVELACNRVPTLADNRKGFVLAASVLSIVVTEPDFSVEQRDLFAMALYGMLRAAHAQRHRHSYEDQHMLAEAWGIYEAFREQVPATPHEAPSNVTASSQERKQQEKSFSKVNQEHERSIDELIKQMKA